MSKPTKANEIHKLIADDIVHGRRHPVASLDEVTLARVFNVSRTPIREAIRQLEMSGLVEARPHRGAVVCDVPKARLDEMFSVMAELEALCARWAATAMNETERRDLRRLHDGSGDFARHGRRDAYVDANNSFHGSLYDGSHNGFLAETTRHVRQRLAPFRRVQFEAENRLAESFAEHERIVAAIERQDADGADAAMRAHIGIVREKVDDVAWSGPSKASPGARPELGRPTPLVPRPGSRAGRRPA